MFTKLDGINIELRSVVASCYPSLPDRLFEDDKSSLTVVFLPSTFEGHWLQCSSTSQKSSFGPVLWNLAVSWKSSTVYLFVQRRYYVRNGRNLNIWRACETWQLINVLALGKLQGHSHLMHMRIGYHFIANLHIALLYTRKRKWEAHLSKPCQFDVFPSQNSVCICVILEEQLFHWYHGECTDGCVQGKPKVNEYLGRRGERHKSAGHFWFQSGILLFWFPSTYFTVSKFRNQTHVIVKAPAMQVIKQQNASKQHLHG